MKSSWQDALWALPNYCGHIWDVSVGILALVTAFILFTKMIMNRDWDALVAMRSVICAALVMVFLNSINSGWTKWLIASFVIGSFGTTILVATNWCNRPDKTVTIRQAIGRWLFGLIDWRKPSTTKHG